MNKPVLGFHILLTFAIALGLPASEARAAIATVDQQNTIGGFTTGNTFNNLPVGDGLGQSFTPRRLTLDVATFALLMPSTATIRLDLFAGAGYGGILLASSAQVTIDGDSFQTAEFDFSSPVALVPGSVYTFRLTLVGNGIYQANYSASDPYAGGDAYLPGSKVASGVDFVFAEGNSAVPEPSAWALIGIGATGVERRVMAPPSGFATTEYILSGECLASQG